MNIRQYIYNTFGYEIYREAYFLEDFIVDEIDIDEQKDKFIHTYEVESYYKEDKNEVKITNNGPKLYNYECTCKDYKKTKKCVHIAYVLIYDWDEIVKQEIIDPFEATKEVLNNYKKTNKIKREVNMQVELEFHKTGAKIILHVGLKKQYKLSTQEKLARLLNAYIEETPLELGKQFTYEPDKMYFNETNTQILNYLSESNESKQDYYYAKTPINDLNDRELTYILEKLKNTKFIITGFGTINNIINDLPTNFKLEKKENIYELNLEDQKNYQALDDYNKYIVYDHNLYILPLKYQKLINSLKINKIKKLSVKKKDLNILKDNLLSQIKNKVELSDDITEIKISKKPEAKLYFDINKDNITCNIKLDYDGEEINYFDKTNKILRDEEYETNLLQDLTDSNFKIENNKAQINDLDQEVNFMEEKIQNLTNKYKVFTSKKYDNTKLIKQTNVKSTFSIGKDGIMKYTFDAKDIDSSEIDKVISSIKNKKRYYRLKDGDIINLEDKNLNELSDIIDDLNLTKDQIKNQEVELPKYKAIYISYKKNQYKTVKTNTLFDEFIDNFNKNKNAKITLDKEDKERLRDYQLEGVKWLYNLYKCDFGGILADEMGLGKSYQTIVFIKQILKEKPNSKILIVCPTALVYNWEKEFKKFAKDLKYITLSGTPEKRQEIFNNIEKYNILITSYGLVRNDKENYQNINFEVCIIDEAQNIKNYQAQMTKEIKKIKAKNKFALTGTPIENSIFELWSIFDFIMPGYLNNINNFKQKYAINDIDEKNMDKIKDLNKQIKPFILRRKKQDVTKELPDKVENNIYLELDNKQKALYLKELKETKDEINETINKEGFNKSKFKILKLLMKLRQICVDPNLIYENYKGEGIKIEKLIDIVNQNKDEHKILIFSSFRKALKEVEKQFDKNNITYYTIDGTVKNKERVELVDKFNKDKTNCFLITLKAGGTGLNLTGADIVIHLDIWWNPQAENQATDRAHRIGQKNKVTVIKLITKGTIEERILELQEKKKTLSDALIENNSDQIFQKLTEKDIKNLLSNTLDEDK